MNTFLKRHATPFIAGLFLVSLISGISLFVHVGANYFRSMHEWLSMVLILPFILHLWKNWRAMTTYFRKPVLLVAVVTSLAAAGTFAYRSVGDNNSGGPPQFTFTRAILNNSPQKVAPLLGEAPEQMVARLHAKGFAAASIDVSLSDTITKSGRDEFEFLAALLEK